MYHLPLPSGGRTPKRGLIKDYHRKNGSSKGQNLSLTGSFGPGPLDSGLRFANAHRIRSTYTYIYVCIYVYILTCTFIYVYIYVYIWTCTHTYVYIHVHMSTYTYVYGLTNRAPPLSRWTWHGMTTPRPTSSSRPRRASNAGMSRTGSVSGPSPPAEVDPQP